jgi:hypothetical protein
MYEALEACAADFNDLSTTLSDPARVARVCAALDACAKQIGEAVGATDIDRDNLAKLYRGMLAAKRIVSQLQEKRGEA